MRVGHVLVVMVGLGCSEPAAPLPRADAPPAEGLAESAWPTLPDGLAAEVRRCVEDYRALGGEGLPPAEPGAPFSSWYRGPFQAWTARYNELRERCDEEVARLDPASAGAQVVFASQSYLHARASRDAARYEEEAQMFVLGRYWALGAACTYQSCERGPDRGWAALCAARARGLPACPPIEPSE